MRDFMIQHIDWLTDLMSTVWKYSKVTVEDYIDWITTPGVPMDFVAITVLCRIYHIHVGIFFNNGASIISGLFPEDSKGKCLHIHVQPCLDF